MGVAPELAARRGPRQPRLRPRPKPISTASSSLEKAVAIHYLRGEKSPLKPHDDRSEISRAATTITDKSNPRSLKPRAEEKNAGRTRDRRSGPPDRRRPIQIRVRDADRIRQGPQGPVRRHRPLHLGQEERAGLDARVAARRLSALADHARADWARVDYPPIDYQDLYYYSAPKKNDGAEVARRDRSGDPETYDKLGIPLREQRSCSASCASRATRRRGRRAPRRGRRGVRLGLGRDHLQGGADEGRRDLHADLGGAARASRPGEEVSRHGGAGDRQFLRDAQLGGVLRRLVRLRAAGRALPDGAVDLFPHQREEHRPVRAHADHRRQGLLCELPRRLHGADARREPAARRRGRADRARRRRDQILDRPELVSGRRATARAASTTSSPSAATAAARARRSPGRRSRPARRSPGNIRAASCAATIRAASSTRSRSRTATSRSTAAPR